MALASTWEVCAMKSLLVGLLILAGLQCALSGRASAQLGANCHASWGNFFTNPTPPGLYNCTSEGGGLTTCYSVTMFCAPLAAPQETGPGCPPAAKAQAGSPICLASGNTYIKETDVRLPGLSGGLTLVRTWNSVWPSTQTQSQIGLFGPNWRSNFEERIFVGSDNYIKYARGDGSFWSFGYGSSTGSLGVAAPANETASMTYGTLNWTLTYTNGEQRVFDIASGNLLSIIDRNGNATQLTYDSVGRLVTVTDPVSRHLYFTYGNSSYQFLVTGVSSDVGLSLSYSYDSQGRLQVVTAPDQSTLNFQYNSQSLITSVTDSNGIILESHTYDGNGRGLTSSQANGVNAVTVSYSQ
jgi:YD repeat-containing protein